MNWWFWITASLTISVNGFNEVALEADNLLSGANQRDSLALLAIYDATDGDNWINTWDLDAPIEEWYGVTVNNDGDVVELDLSNNGLTGRLPHELGFLIELTSLKLGFNSLRGNLPISIGGMPNLEEIFLFENLLDLPIPDTLTNLGNLKILSLASNDIPGEIPRRIGNMTSLEMLVLDRNQLLGGIPESIGDLGNLTFLDLHNNRLNDTIPQSIGQLSNLKELLLYNNDLQGSIPESIAMMDSLQFCWLHDNRLSGKTPSFSIDGIRSIRLDQNRLTELPDLTHLTLGPGFPDGLSVERNELSFDDIILNRSLRQTARFSYRPQDTIRIAPTFYANRGDRLEVELPFDDTLSTSRYKWFRDQNLFQLTDVNFMAINNIQPEDEGTYYVEINNDVIGDLTLVTSKFKIVVRDSADCDNPMAGSACTDAPLFCHSSDIDLYCGSLPVALDTMMCPDIGLLQETRWVGFTADSTSTEIVILPYSCNSQQAGIQVAVYEGCLGKRLIYCSNTCERTDVTINLNNVVEGEAYYIAIRSCGGQCKYQIRATSSGHPYIPEINGEIVGPDTVCGPFNMVEYTVNNLPSSIEFLDWYIEDDTIRTVDPGLKWIWGELGPSAICVRAYSECGQSELKCMDVEVYPGLSLDEIVYDVVQNDSFYTVSFRVEGGVGPITIDGIGGVYNAVNRIFVSDLIRCGQSFQIQVTDRNGCLEVLEGLEVCNCSSEAGRLPQTTLTACVGEGIFGATATGTMPDSNDAVSYVLTPNDVFARSEVIIFDQQGSFGFVDSLMTTDKIYYIYQVVGNNDGNGRVDLSDPCLSSSNARSAIFFSKPIADAGLDTFYCERNFYLRAAKSKNQSNVIWTQLSGPSSAVIEDERSEFTFVRTAAEGVYRFEWTESLNSCEDRDTVTVEIKPTLEGQIVGPDSICQGQFATLILDRAFSRYLWDGGSTNAELRISGPGQYCVRVFTDDGCTRRFCKNIVSSNIATPNIMGRNVLCPGDTEVLQVIPNYKSYRWSTGDTSFFISIDTGGLYCITVTDFNGCEADDCILVNQQQVRRHEIKDTICYGDSVVVFEEVVRKSGNYEFRQPDGQLCDSVVTLDLLVLDSMYISDSLIVKDDGNGTGAISVNIRGGRPPYDYSWNTGATLPFINMLIEGVYTLEVKDANDCVQSFVFDLRNSNASKDLLKHDFVIMPNPVQAGKHITLKSRFITRSNQALSYKIHDTNGSLISRGAIVIDRSRNSGLIPIPQDLDGVYLLYISDGTIRGSVKIVVDQ